ncbi:MAG: glutaredoxin [Pseudomonadota bacterium]|nr:glutaredoxin [Pseudomonadota bacterium]
MSNPHRPKNVTVYTKNHCGYCEAAKRLLSLCHLEYQEINIEHATNPESILQDIRSYTSARTFPQIIFDGKCIGGYTELNAYVDQHMLNQGD